MDETTTTTTPAPTPASAPVPAPVPAIDSNEPNEDDDLDSSWGGDIASETTSLNSSIFNYRHENGRRYHAYKDGEYWGPNDEKQNEQLDIAHHLWTLLLDGKLYLAPISKSAQRILDVGCGTGIWTVGTCYSAFSNSDCSLISNDDRAEKACSDMADMFPSAEIIGTDLSPTQPQWVPPNCKFEIDDCTENWTFQESSFDFIHVRSLYGCIRDWPAFYREVYKHLKPGGWYEQVEYAVRWSADDGSIPKGHVFERWGDVFEEAGEKMGKTFKILDQQKQFLFDHGGFQNVTEQRYKMPVGPWSRDRKLKEVGRWHLLECYEGIEGWSMAMLTRLMGWSVAEVHVFLAEVRAAFKDRSVHGYSPVSVVYAQKPFNASSDAV